MKFSIALILISISLPTHGSCQNTRHFQWFNAGFGLTTDEIPDSVGGVNLALDYYYLISKKSTLQFGISIGGEVFTSEDIASFLIGYGKTIVLDHAIFGAYLAPSLDFGHTEEGKSYVTVGINATLQAVYHPIFNVGLALELFGQLNPKQSAAGFRIMLHFNNTNRKLE